MPGALWAKERTPTLALSRTSPPSSDHLEIGDGAEIDVRLLDRAASVEEHRVVDTAQEQVDGAGGQNDAGGSCFGVCAEDFAIDATEFEI